MPPVNGLTLEIVAGLERCQPCKVGHAEYLLALGILFVMPLTGVDSCRSSCFANLPVIFRVGASNEW